MEVLAAHPNDFVPCAIYCRVSTDEQAKVEHFSLRALEDYGRDEIEKRKGTGWFHKITITDPGYSGALLERPGLVQLIALATQTKLTLAFAQIS